MSKNLHEYDFRLIGSTKINPTVCDFVDSVAMPETPNIPPQPLEQKKYCNKNSSIVQYYHMLNF